VPLEGYRYVKSANSQVFLQHGQGPEGLALNLRKPQGQILVALSLVLKWPDLGLKDAVLEHIPVLQTA